MLKLTLLIVFGLCCSVLGLNIHEQAQTIEKATATCMGYLGKNKFFENDIRCNGNQPHVFDKHIVGGYSDCRKPFGYPYTAWLKNGPNQKQNWKWVWDQIKGKSAVLNQRLAISTIGRKCSDQKKDFDKGSNYKTIVVVLANNCIIPKTPGTHTCLYTVYPTN